MGKRLPAGTWRWGGVAILIAAAGTSLAGLLYSRGLPPFRKANAVTFAEAFGIVRVRCAPCHSMHPTFPRVKRPPNGIVFDTPEEVSAHAQHIKYAATVRKDMPFANVTHITPDERAKLAAWVDEGAKLAP